VSGASPFDSSVRTPRTGGADGAVHAYRAAPGLSARSGGNFSAGHVLNGEPSGMTGRIVAAPSVTIRPTTQGAA
jgi:hypothetical protein